MIYTARRAKSQKPLAGTVEINSSHWLAQSIEECFLHNEGGGQVRGLRGASLAATGTVPFRATVGGWATEYTGSGGNYLSGISRRVYANTEPHTLCCRVIPTAIDSASGGFNILFTNWTTDILSGTGLGWSSTGFLQFWWNGASGAITSTTAQITTNVVNHIGGVWDGAGHAAFYLNGKAFDTGGSGGTWSGGTGQYVFGALGPGYTADAALGYVLDGLNINRALSASEVADVYFNPYGFVRPRVARMYSLPKRPAGAAPHLIPVGQVIETDLAQPITRLKSKTLGQTSETDLAQPITRGAVTKLIPVGQVTETDLAQAITRRKSKSVGQLLETDLAQTLSVRKALALGQALETNLARALSHLKIRSVGLVSETDVAQVLGRAKRLSIGQADEVDLALKITAHGGAAGGGGAGTGGSGILRTIRG